ncbi:MAG: SUMF1/EgtB/PvdO family nonheme iron enzyme, partial [Deltaproteobacteria bacterium]|nr:SUMF1/EgtB/PvdO family nonheme iron enzyme [Deltaproteobacteria bacterium]
AHDDDIDAAAVSPDGGRIASCSHDRSVRLWDLESGAPCGRLTEHTDEVEWVSWSPGGERLATASLDGKLRVFDARSQRAIGHSPGRDRSIARLALSAGDGLGIYRRGGDGRIALVHGDRTLRLLDAELNPLAVRDDIHQRAVKGVAWTPGGESVLSASLDGTVREWNVRGRSDALGGTPREWTLDSGVYGVDVSPDGHSVAFGVEDGGVLLAGRSPATRPEPLRAHREACYAVAWSPDGRRLASAARDGSVLLHDLDKREALELTGHEDMVLCLRWSADGNWLASTSRDRTARLWDARGRCRHVLRGHALTVWSGDFDPANARLATCSFDKTVRIFDLESGTEERCLVGHTRQVSTLVWAPDGHILTGSRDATLRRWDPRTGVAEVLDEAGREQARRGLVELISDAASPLLARISAGNALGLLGDPRIDALAPALCAVPLGPFWMGLDESEVADDARRYGIPEAWLHKATPRHRVELDAFEIATFPVTQGEYAQFLRATGVDEIPAHWPGPEPPPYRTNHVVAGRPAVRGVGLAGDRDAVPGADRVRVGEGGSRSRRANLSVGRCVLASALQHARGRCR